MMGNVAGFAEKRPDERGLVVRLATGRSWRPVVVTRDGQSGQEPAQLSVLVLAVAQRQDRAAFRALFVHFAPRLKSYLVRLGTSGAHAEDIVQETMLTLWRKAPLFDPS